MKLLVKIRNLLNNTYIFSRLLNFFDNLKIREKLIISYFLVTVIPVVAIGFFSYTATLSYVKAQYVASMSSAQMQYKINIVNRLKSYMRLADTIYFDQKIQKILAGNYNNRYEEFDLIVNYLTPVLTPLLEATGKNINLDLISFNNSNGEVLNNNFDGIMGNITTHNSFAGGTKSFNLYNMERVEDRDWFKSVKGKLDKDKWVQIGGDTQYNNVSFLEPLINFKDLSKKQIGMLKISVRITDIIDDGQPSDKVDEEFHMIFDSNNRLLTDDGNKSEFLNKYRDKLYKCLELTESNKSMFVKDYVFVKDSVDLTGWKIVSVNPIKKMNETAKRIRNTTILYCLVALGILFLVTYMLSASFSGRITKISSSMNKFYSGNFDVVISDIHKDEIGYLARTFNEMATRINTLITDNFQANIDKKEAQLKALQAQINPHFLYNSLSCISRLGNIKDSEGITKMVKSLTKFYRMTLNKGKDIISIADELEQVKAYIDVFKIRKGEDFDVFFDLDDNVLTYSTIKVILQPFIENVLEHAIYNREKPITVIVCAKLEEDSIVFKIIDDGVGIKRENIEGIFLNNTSVSKGYGIKNVNDRIKLQFGSEYGVKIFSRQGIGTAVNIVIPRYMV